MTQPVSRRRRSTPRSPLWLWVALAVLLVAVYLLSRPGPAAPDDGPAIAITPVPAEASPAAAGFQAGEVASAPAPTANSFAAGVAAAETPADSVEPAATPKPTRTRRPTATPTRPPRVTATPNDGLATIRFDDLPRQAQETIRLIDRGGPFPYRQDGTVFQNRERLLPRQSSGYYREYTVVTPGESDRGARRIVAGASGELYYTADHYASFKRVVR